ncbi:unnamed protein product [Hymenolepis diminuta]|uniref:Uncharacterized protein n=1 Tax=Hymenolepis diminuta TaxID=6216 RepID=A0A564Y5H0_HYMDI|nr:unnamed protein product [Hymenolepis diminuta]
MIGSNPGELVVHSLLKQFASICQSMVENALDEKANNDLLKCLRLSEDTAFQQLLTALYSCAEHALPCLLQTITKWYDTQHSSGSHYPFRRTSSKAGVRSQTLSVATGQAVSNPASGGRELLIRSMLVESSTTTMGVTQGVTIPSQEINNAVPSSANTGQDPPNTAISSLAQETMAERRDVRRNSAHLKSQY